MAFAFQVPEVKIPDEFAQKTRIKTKALEIDGSLLWVCPGHLSEKSPFFECLFFADFGEKDKDAIELKEKDLEVFIVFLQILTDSRDMKELDMKKHHKEVIKLANEFLSERVMQKAFKFLTEKIPEISEEIRSGGGVPVTWVLNDKLSWMLIARYPKEVFEPLHLAYDYRRQDVVMAFFAVVARAHPVIIKHWVNHKMPEEYPEKLKMLLMELAADIQKNRFRGTFDHEKLGQIMENVREKVATLFLT